MGHTPDERRPRFNPEHFATSKDTLYLLSKKGGPTSALVAALADAVFTAAAEAGERAGGRLPEPMRAVLDEAATICKIADLPDLYSHLGSRGGTPLVILQSYRQGVKAWGEVGMDAMWSAATKKVIGVGLDDAKFAADISSLVGAHFVHRGSYSKSKDGYSRSAAEQREQIMDPAEIRAMRKGTALLLATGMPVAQIAYALGARRRRWPTSAPRWRPRKPPLPSAPSPPTKRRRPPAVPDDSNFEVPVGLFQDVEDLKAQVARLAAEVTGLTGLTEAAAEGEAPTDDTTDTGETPGEAGEEERTFPPFILLLDAPEYDDGLRALVEWVEGVLVPGYLAEPSSDARWCAMWFEHPVAVARLHACWLAWQELTDPATSGYTGPSVWHRDHLGPCLRELRAPSGPFAGCVKGEHQIDHRLPDLVPSAWRSQND
ncbi:TraM recognition domain-containing protein [Streptomyces sp. A012304]|uniref:TraM recognition domain-containing protein n=1 Tax=Streptomyces sp. A012304 TaxID=375446 RepID=UPI002231A583|nr:TraM recognition domain-containing protein [Streptomyces sp. A012304]GKQ40703.1 hypothetical protein ALMP_72260 [Streptomyces sp. A012304]